MAGLKLSSGFNVGGNYTPLSPAAANPPSSSAGSIGQMAYGISGTGETSQSSIAGIGSLITGAVATALLVYLWWSLPR